MDEFLAGGELILEMGATPSGWGAKRRPPSQADTAQLSVLGAKAP
jgi:hypothetical protein